MNKYYTYTYEHDASAAGFCRGYKLGFTLIELLVVISIISLLLSFILPAVNRARSLARQTVCASQLRQWGLAFQMYIDQNDEYYPHIDGRDRCSSTIPITPEGLADYYYGWIDVLPPLLGEQPWRDHRKWHYPRTDTIFQCPSAQLAPLNLYNYLPIRNGFFSYAMNSCLELDRNCWPPYDQPGGNNMPSFLKAPLVEHPAEVILLFDQLLDPQKGYDGRSLNRSAGKHCGSYPKAFSARHVKNKDELGGLILFCDYHVEWRSSVWRPHWPEDLEVPFRSDSEWFPY